MQEVLQCLKKYGQRLDLELAAEMRVPPGDGAQAARRTQRRRGGGDVQADALRSQQDDRGVAVPGVGVRAGAGPGEEAEGGVARALRRSGRSRPEVQHVRGSSRERRARRVFRRCRSPGRRVDAFGRRSAGPRGPRLPSHAGSENPRAGHMRGCSCRKEASAAAYSTFELLRIPGRTSAASFGLSA